MQHIGLTGECWIIGEVVDNDQYLKHILVSSVLHEVCDIMLSVQDLVKGFRVIVVEVDRILVCMLDLHLFLDILFHWQPRTIYNERRPEYIDSRKSISLNVQ